MSTDESDTAEGARMVLGPDAIHEADDDRGLSVDCPQCGAAVTVLQIVEEGECTGRLDADVAEAAGDDEQLATDCNAQLSLELVWES